MYKCRFCGCELTEENWYQANQKNRHYHCKCCHKEQVKKNSRKSKITTRDKNGKNIYIYGLNKRPLPEGRICELCDKPANKMDYHHWDDKSPSKGVWLCYFCHKHVHMYESGLINKYLILKEKIDKEG